MELICECGKTLPVIAAHVKGSHVTLMLQRCESCRQQASDEGGAEGYLEGRVDGYAANACPLSYTIKVLNGLCEWNTQMGTFEARIWNRADRYRHKLMTIRDTRRRHEEPPEDTR